MSKNNILKELIGKGKGKKAEKNADKKKGIKEKISGIKFPDLKSIKSGKGRGQKTDKEQSVKTVKQTKFNSLFSIRNKIAVCFLVPIVFMIIIGVSSYQKAAEGMSENYRESSLETMKMATEYIDMSCDFIQTDAMTYVINDDLTKYMAGVLEKDPLAKLDVMDNINGSLGTTQTSNPFISNIHIITNEGVRMFTSKPSSKAYEGFFKEYMEVASEDGRSVAEWVDSHDLIDEKLELKKSDYILSYQRLTQTKTAGVVIDIKADAVREFLQGLDMGKGSIVGFVTPNGREIICEHLEEGEESVLPVGEAVFFGQEFFSEVGAGEGAEVLEGSKEVEFLGKDYLFIYSRSAETNATVCSLVPMSEITAQAQDIRNLTILVVILATIIVLAVGIIIVAGIQNNMGRISKKFGEVAKGDLTVQVVAKGRDEFNNLAGSATHMISNTKKLVNKVTLATGQLEESAKDVEQASGIIDDYSKQITRTIGEINEGMERQSRHAQECVEKTDVLASEMQEVSRVVERVEKLVDETEGMINRGVEIVYLLGDRAKETTDITEKVGESIESLRKETEIINSFVKTITEITEQTNLLSLNASIEAARAGDAGRGFAVVAEEIRKLADDSAKAAGEIKKNVGHISAQTKNSVDSAHQASDMVNLQTEAVEEVVAVFRDMQQRMTELVEGLKDIVISTEKADRERSDTAEAIKNISDIIEATATSAETVNEVAVKLLKNVERLNKTADVLGENMDGLKSEISVFKI